MILLIILAIIIVLNVLLVTTCITEENIGATYLTLGILMSNCILFGVCLLDYAITLEGVV